MEIAAIIFSLGTALYAFMAPGATEGRMDRMYAQWAEEDMAN